MSAHNDNNGGPAFPVLPPLGPDDTAAVGYPYVSEGMSLRDYLAAKADVGDFDHLSKAVGVALLGRSCPSVDAGARGCLEWWAEYRAALRYMEADAMLKAREMTSGGTQ